MRLRTRPQADPTFDVTPAPSAPEGPEGPDHRGRGRRAAPRSLFARMTVRDLARDRGTTTVLILLMMLSVTLATASVGTLARLFSAAGDLMARADAPHVLQMHAGSYDPQEVEAWAAGRAEVVHHQAMLMLGIDGANLSFAGEPQTASIQQNSLVVPNQERDLLLDLDGQPILEVEPGTIVLPVYHQLEAELEVGDTVRITAADGFAKELTIAGFARDSIMNPAIASSKRLAVSATDLEEVRAHTGDVEYLLEFWLQDPAAQTAAFEKAYLDSGLPKDGQMVDSATFRLLTLIGDGIVAAVVVFVSMLLLVVGLLCLRFSFLTAAEQDYREIGVLKAIGVAPRDIRRIYLAKYGTLAALASLIGLVGGWALTPLLTRNITRYLGSGSSGWDRVLSALTALTVFAVLVLFVLVLLRRFRRITAVTALRSGATGQQSNAVRLRLHRSRLPVHVQLGTMDVVGRWPTYLLLLFVFAVSTFILIVPVNSATTANAPDFIHYMGIGPVDVRVDLDHNDDTSAELYARIVSELDADPRVRTLSTRVTTRHDTVDRDGVATSLYVENGDHEVLPVRYAEGRAPRDGSEIALSLLALHEVGGEVGGTLPLEVAGERRELAIVGSYQDITRGGKTAKSSLPTDREEAMWYVAGVALVPGADAAEVAGSYAEPFAPATVADIDRWREQTLGPIAGQVSVTAAVSAVLAVALAALMTALFARMLLARDQGQIAIQRAIGADDAGLRQQYLTRMLLVLVLGVLLGTLAANTLGERLFNLMFEGLYGGFEALGQGTSRIEFAVRPLLAYVALPLTLLTTVTAATLASARSISAADVSALTTE